ncbi:MAG: hypothetical protein AB1353_00415 [Aquificota bacterium]
MMFFAGVLLSFALLFAHDLEHTIRREGNCVVVSFFFPDGGKFSYEEYKVYKEGERAPFQIGRTDALGRVVFCPREGGLWTVITYSEDGHGAQVKISFEEKGLKEEKNLLERYGRVLAGLGWLLGMFGLWKVYLKRAKG